MMKANETTEVMYVNVATGSWETKTFNTRAGAAHWIGTMSFVVAVKGTVKVNFNPGYVLGGVA